MANVFKGFGGPKPKIDIPPVVVIGLGRFGASLATELMAHGVEVLGMDSSEKLVREQAHYLTDAVCADSTDPEALRQLGVHEVERVVLAIGTHLEASILTASNLVEMGVSDIWAKATSEAHGRILTQIGVHHVIRPERDTGRRVAHLLGGRFRDFAEIAPDYGVTRLAPPPSIVGRPLDIAKVWDSHDVQLVSVREGDGSWSPLRSGDVLSATDFIVVAGSPAALESFASRGQR
ncbi:potassium channel family protein [Corynebacterium liangguodongii]|uniref:Potassium transporter n=1 Tax=Corynebacterium liangguodongii TaxID=2079535 RepID=A0A2S0WBM6_9CORY|nr:TrkA family potassium uptake protein [Corynebacterium liangguodongii]AWB83167.1 potassium transporter [Corynebacterium liangguodongii]PWB98762.1 TrkA family potassium uptake protein [Corynebacterium liangguodongii]